MMQTSPNSESLTVLIAGQPIGKVKVAARQLRKLYGMFQPRPEFETYRPVFETAVELARRFDATPETEPCDYLLWDRLMAAYDDIKRLGLTIDGFPSPVEEFGLHGDWSVEITLGATVD